MESDSHEGGTRQYTPLFREAGYISLAITAVLAVLMTRSESTPEPLIAALGGGAVAALMFATAEVIERV